MGWGTNESTRDWGWGHAMYQAAARVCVMEHKILGIMCSVDAVICSVFLDIRLHNLK